MEDCVLYAVCSLLVHCRLLQPVQCACSVPGAHQQSAMRVSRLILHCAVVVTTRVCPVNDLLTGHTPVVTTTAMPMSASCTNSRAPSCSAQSHSRLGPYMLLKLPLRRSEENSSGPCPAPQQASASAESHVRTHSLPQTIVRYGERRRHPADAASNALVAQRICYNHDKLALLYSEQWQRADSESSHRSSCWPPSLHAEKLRVAQRRVVCCPRIGQVKGNSAVLQQTAQSYALLEVFY